ncbi:hypothetical protein ABZ726_38095, partial [Streptomyces hundungensis]
VRPDGRRTTVTYDDAGFPIRVTGADGLTVRQHLIDERGCQVHVDAQRGQLVDEPGARPHPADAKPAPVGLAERTDRHDLLRLALMSEGHERRGGRALQ